MYFRPYCISPVCFTYLNKKPKVLRYNNYVSEDVLYFSSVFYLSEQKKIVLKVCGWGSEDVL